MVEIGRALAIAALNLDAGDALERLGLAEGFAFKDGLQPTFPK